MKVLMSVTNILLDVDLNNAEMLNDAAKIAFNRAKAAYEIHFSGGETYIDDDDYPGDSILWGAKEPEKLIRVVSHWNEDIRQDFKKALAEYINGRNEETGEMPFNDRSTAHRRTVSGAAAVPGSERLRRAMCSRSCRNTASPRV